MFPAPVRPPIYALGLNPGPCFTLGGLPVMGPSVSLVSLPLLTCVFLGLPESSVALFLFRVDVFARG